MYYAVYAHTLCQWNNLYTRKPHVLPWPTPTKAAPLPYILVHCIQSWLEGLFCLPIQFCHSKGFEWTAQLSITIPTLVMSVQSPVSVI